MATVGFIGLGLMGNAMVSRLLDKKYDLTVLANRSRTNVDAAIARGASEAATPKALAEASDIVMICVDTSASVEARMWGTDGVIAGLKPDAIVIDFGTSLPASTRTLAQEVADAGGAYLDAPLGRTPQHAFDGLLNIMCAGDKAAFDRVEPVLDDDGFRRRLWHRRRFVEAGLFDPERLERPRLLSPDDPRRRCRKRHGRSGGGSHG